MEKKINVTCPNCGAELTIEKKAIKTAQDRIEALRIAGVDVSNLFAMSGANGGDYIGRNANGRLEIVSDDDPIFQYIVTAGTVNNKHLFRRWVMAQMFYMLSAKSCRSNYPIGFTDMLHSHGYEYTWKMLINELYAQMKMYKNGDHENFHARQLFFNNKVAYAMAEHYIAELQDIVKNKRVKKCKGVPYVTISGQHFFVADLPKKIYNPLHKLAMDIRFAKDINELYYLVCKFNDERQKLNWRTPQCPQWVDAFKGVGSYYTLQNMIRFHGCFMWDDNGKKLTKEQSLYFLDQKAEAYADEGWRLLGVLKKALKDNNIDIEKKMAEWRK